MHLGLRCQHTIVIKKRTRLGGQERKIECLVSENEQFSQVLWSFFVPTLERLVSWRQVGEAFVSGTAVVGEFQNVLGCPWCDLLSA